MSRRTSPLSVRVLAALLLGAALVSPSAAALLPTGAEPRFHLQAIEVRGARHVSSAVVVSESLLEAGRVYTESELRAAVLRIRRLPFIVDVAFSLGKGSERGTYVLLVDVHETRRFFFELDAAQTYSGEPLAFDSTGALDDNLVSSVTGGTRLFVGRYGMLFAAAGNEGARLGFTRYNLFRRNAVLSVGLSSQTCCATAVAPLGLDPALSAWIDEGAAESATISLGVPLGAHQSVTGSLARRDSERGFRRPLLARESGSGFFDFEDRREAEVRLAWSYDGTDDPVLPFDGRALAVSLDYRSLEAELAPAPGAAPAEMRSELLRVSVMGRRHWPFARRHSFAAGLGLALGRARVENLPVQSGELEGGSLTSWELTATIRHTALLADAKRARRFHELYWQNELEYSVDGTRSELTAAYRPLEVAALSSALVFRNDWCVLRFGLRVIDVGDVL